MPEENENETPTRRSQLQKELNSLGELIRILKPLSAEQRARILETTKIMLGEPTQE